MFKLFKVGELFDIHPTSAYKMKNNELFATAGRTPVMSNSSVNNGIGGYCGLAPTEQGGMITFSDTTTGVDTMFYQAEPFIGYPHVQGMYPYQSDKWNENSCLYVMSCIRKSAGNGWNYAVKFNRTLVKELPVELPVVESSDPDHEYTIDDIDYEYMQERITELEQERITELDAYLKACGLNDYELTAEDKEVLALSGKPASDEDGTAEDNRRIRMKEFRIGDLFTQLRGKEAAPNRVPDGDINMVNETSTNNGITKKALSNHVFPSNTITISVNYATTVFYQLEPYCASVNILILQNEHLNPENGAYIVTLLRKNNEQYDYNHKISKDRLNNTVISLPVTTSGEPDWDYMEKYIKAVEKVVIADVVKYKDKVIAATKGVVAQN